MSQFLQQSLSPSRTGAMLTHGLLPRRFCAFLVDGILIGIIGWALALGILLFGILTLGLGWLMFHIIPLVPFLYYTFTIGGSGATPGQRLLGLAVRQDANLSLPNLAQALVWTVLFWLSFVLACVPFALALVGPRHRAGHDLLSGLVVIRNLH